MNIGIWQIVLVLLVILLLFGAGKLPQMMVDMGKGIRGFKREMARRDAIGDAQLSSNPANMERL